MKVINPSRKRDTKTLTWHVTDVFTSPLQMKERLIESFCDYVPGIPEIGKFNVGFFESRNSTGKRWIVSSEDLERMYRKFESGSEIPLWCDGKSDGISSGKKRTTEETKESGSEETSLSKREKKQANIDHLSLELEDKHGDKFSGPQYKLWARLIDNGQWDNTDRPPNIPVFGTTLPKKGMVQKESTTEVIANAAVAIIKHLQSPPQPNMSNTDTGSNSIGISPGKKAKLRKEYLDQLKDIQKLRDDGTLTQEEFQEEKCCILGTLKSMK